MSTAPIKIGYSNDLLWWSDALKTARERRPGQRFSRGTTMTKDLGVWTDQACALVLIDYQKEMFQTIRSETSADLAELNVRLLARTAKAFNMPVVLSTVGVAYHINSPTQPAIAADLPGVQPIDRTSLNGLTERTVLERVHGSPIREAVQGTRKKRLILRGLHSDPSLPLP